MRPGQADLQEERLVATCAWFETVFTEAGFESRQGRPFRLDDIDQRLANRTTAPKDKADVTPWYALSSRAHAGTYCLVGIQRNPACGRDYDGGANKKLGARNLVKDDKSD